MALELNRAQLLPLTALLRWFDSELLAALAYDDTSEITALLASDQVTPNSQPSGTYSLRADLAAEQLAYLRAEQPLAEIAIYTQAFEYFLQRLQYAGDDAWGVQEEACLYYLEKLYPLLTQRLDWRSITNHIAAVRAASPRDQRHLHRLSLYEGYVAVRTEQYEHGTTILTQLLAHTELENETRAKALLGLAQAQWYQTRYDRALDFYQQLLEFAQETNDRLNQGLALINMGSVYNELEHFERAVELSMQSLPIFRELREPIREAHALYRIGLNALYLGRWQTAQEYLDQAISLFEQLNITEGLALLYWSRGFMHHMLGDEQQSEQSYRQALTLTLSPEYADPYHTQEILKGLGFLYQLQHRFDEALSNYDQAIALATSLRGDHWLSQIHYRRGNVFQNQGQYEAALDAYEQAVRGIETLRAATETEEIKIGLLGTTQQFYESAVLLCLEQNRPADAFAYVERARSQAFLDQLAKKSPELYETFDQPVATLAQIQSALPEGALLIEYFTIGVLPYGQSLISRLPPENTHLRNNLTLPPQLWIFAISRDSFTTIRADIDPNKLRPNPSAPVPSRYLLRERLLPFLYENLIAPVEQLLEGRDLVYIVPHGPLHYVPFVALRAADGRYLLRDNGPALAFAPSATVLLRSCLNCPPRSTDTFLALGYNDEGDEALRFAEPEARLIAHHAGGQAWVGPEPKSQRLIEVAPTLRRLHIAGHAFYHPDDPLGSELRLGQGDSLTARRIIAELSLGADLVTLSACTSGLSRVASGDELLGIQRALLFAGASTIVCALWEATDAVAIVLMDRFYALLRAGSPAAVALRDAQVWLRSLTGRELIEIIRRWQAEHPQESAELGDPINIPPELLETPVYADPFHWAPFMLIGNPG